ncbi:MAG: bifunctional enoyl-CoA hydratase/phosphate acetyltransferase [Alphaproteobacteria bacterium]|nr:bifunctional enoyl-CoA hydratase/phosphate acetyltransferase [Alphaproteobacteria bacterium]
MQTKINIDLIKKHFLERAKGKQAMRTAVVHPCSAEALLGAVDAQREGLIEPVLVGPRYKIEALAEKGGWDISAYPLVDVPHSHAAAQAAVEMARDGKVEGLMKGSLHTDELMSEVVRPESGLRTERRISHVFAMATEHYHKPFLITDAAINIAPNLLTKRDIVQNAVDLLIAISERPIAPKVAALSAVETVNPALQSTVDAACLCKMADRGQIAGAIVDGPLAFDNAISAEAARIKEIHSPVAGDADIFLAPDLESGNILAKQLILLSQTSSAGVILGARVPIVLTSRSDGVESRIGSCALAVLMADARRNRRATPP